MTKVTLVYRDQRFSPRSVAKDALILEAVGRNLQSRGLDVAYVGEADLQPDNEADLYLTMARGSDALHVLQEKEQAGRLVLNGTAGVRLATNRLLLDDLERRCGLPVAPLCNDDSRPASDGDGFWLKRGDGASRSPLDVQYVRTWTEVGEALQQFRNRGIGDVLVSGHVTGDVVKFYGVRGTSFFRYYYPTDDGDTRFGTERRNGPAHHYHFSSQQLHEAAEQLSAASGVAIYGGDCVVRDDGTFALIDFNDWPSFARCRAEAASAICRLVENDMT